MHQTFHFSSRGTRLHHVATLLMLLAASASFFYYVYFEHRSFTETFSTQTAHAQVPPPLFSCDFDGAGTTVSDRFNNCAVSFGLTPTVNDAGHIALGPGFSGQGVAETFNAGQSYATSMYHTFPAGTKAVTMVWEEKFSVWPGSSGNSKDIRLYNGSYGSLDFFVGNIPAHFSDDEHFSNWHTGIATMNPAVVTAVSLGCGCPSCTQARCCYDAENGCPLGNNQYTTTPTDGSQPGRLNFSWSVNGKNFKDLGWHKMRVYARMPTSSGATDGEITFWADDVQVFDMVNVGRLGGGDNFTVLSWFPAEDGNVSYVHSMDDFVVYPGLVAPAGAPPPVCGNGTPEAGEACDTGASNGACPATCSTSCTVNSCADTTPPVILGVASSNFTATGATILWTTNENSDSQVEYGLTTAYGSQTTLNASLVTSHSQNLSSLTASTIYHYRVKSKDAAGNLATSGDFTFTTTAASASDTTPPTSVSNSAPSNNATGVSTSPTLTASTATDPSGPIQYYFELFQNATCSGVPTQTRAYNSSTNWNPASLQLNTQYSFHNKAEDAASTPNQSGFSTCTTFTTQATAAATTPFTIVPDQPWNTASDLRPIDSNGVSLAGSWETNGKNVVAIKVWAPAGLSRSFEAVYTSPTINTIFLTKANQSGWACSHTYTPGWNLVDCPDGNGDGRSDCDPTVPANTWRTPFSYTNNTTYPLCKNPYFDSIGGGSQWIWGDSCSQTQVYCRLEFGINLGGGSAYLPGERCGDGIKNGPEDCDKGTNNGACPKTCTTQCGNQTCTGGGGGPGGGSFATGTKVLTPEGPRNIEDLQKGDSIISYDLATGTMHTSQIDERRVRPSTDYYLINGTIQVTAEHPLAVYEKGSIVWKKVKDLKRNDILASYGGNREPITSIELFYKAGAPLNVYNPQVSDFNDYFVLIDTIPVLVHNKALPCDPRVDTWCMTL